MKNMFDASCMPCKLGNKEISHLLYADDLILFSESRQGLQCSLNKLSEYCLKWKLKINLDKSKVMIFRPSGRLTNDSFSISGHIILNTSILVYIFQVVVLSLTEWKN